MLFVKADKLKVGMRLARPIYNKKGVLLYERNSKLTSQGVSSIYNFGLIGIYILEPAEPVPPMTADDIAFERFQTMMVFAIREELRTMIKTKKASNIQTIVNYVIKNYGSLSRKINFIQSLRSKEDQVYKHSLNVAILSALMSNAMKLSKEEQLDVVQAALLHDIGKVLAMEEIGNKTKYNEQEQERMKVVEQLGHNLIGELFSNRPSVRALCGQNFQAIEAYERNERCKLNLKPGANILMVAEIFDSLTAMQYKKEPDSEISVIKMLLKREDVFNKEAVYALINTINILAPGVSVELNNGEKSIVVVENRINILRPILLNFKTNTICDLSNLKEYGNLEIKDIMKTLDNRYIFDVETLLEHGYKIKQPEFIDVDVVDNEDTDEDVAEYVPGRFF